MKIQDNTFAAACYNQNSIAELNEALRNGPDAADMEEWGISPAEWSEHIKLAIAAKLEDEEAL